MLTLSSVIYPERNQTMTINEKSPSISFDIPTDFNDTRYTEFSKAAADTVLKLEKKLSQQSVELHIMIPT